ncbi:GAF domain-containing protein [Roseospira marina]|uniref:GAF domain-containing protein n=2 Tax=Roseospira marina TaxID=140057 RepID=A0A5M6I9G9_9PROT|nr:GAF domain-containing protein [Roseospira marina]
MMVLLAALEWRAYRDAMGDLEGRLNTFVTTAKGVLAAPLWTYDYGQARSLVRVMGNQPDIRALRVLDIDSAVVAQTGDPASLTPGGPLLRDVLLVHTERNEATSVGSFQVAFDTTRVWRNLKRDVATDLLIIVVTLSALVGLVVVATSRLVFRPLDHLHRAMVKDPRPGEQRHVTPMAKDELGDVIEAFNAMERRRAMLEETRSRLIELGIQMDAERTPRRLAETVLRSAMELCSADGGAVLVRDEHSNQLQYAVVLATSITLRMGGEDGTPMALRPVPLTHPNGTPRLDRVASHVAITGRLLNTPSIYHDSRFDPREFEAFDRTYGYSSRSHLAVPLRTRGGEIIGVLELSNAIDPRTRRVGPFDEVDESIAQVLAAQAGVALENQILIESQRRLLDSFIELMAGAIDAKSPYTGGHCSRVPELTRLLTEAACRDTEQFADFDLTEAEWYELHIASWLHDCGKVTSPEYVVDKATKLETIYNRIHEIRTRFEVLWRDAELAECRARLAGADPATAAAERDRTQAALLDDFGFVAACNVGGEYMDDDSIERLNAIGARSWTRHFDDRLGLSIAETERLRGIPPRPLPATERLLSDKAEHVVPWPNDTPPIQENDPRGFTMVAPPKQFNFGELYNLSIRRGTLTEEERFKVNDHIVQTIVMLESLPLPKHLRRVPEYAGGHHERMDGSGYPRALMAGSMSIPARIMAIADIYEALTAADRPYKKPKAVSEALGIMAKMRDTNHIDPDLFDLFLRAGVWRSYAEMYLRPEQIDAVDVSAYLKR